MPTPAPYSDACNNTLFTLGTQDNPTPFQYLDACGNTDFYSLADQNVVLGPVFLPQIYAKGLDVLEIASSGQVVMSINDQASIAFKNDSTNNVTMIESRNSQSIAFDPTDANRTVVVGHTTIDVSNNYQRLDTVETLGFKIMNPTNLSNGLTVSGQSSSSMSGSLNVSGSASLGSKLSVGDQAYLKKQLDVSGAVQVNSTFALRGVLDVMGAVIMQDDLSVSDRAAFADSVGVSGSVRLESSLSVNGQVIFKETVVATGAASMGSEVIVQSVVDVCGATILQSSLSVANNSYFQSSIGISGSVVLGNTVTAKDSAYLNTVRVSDSATLSDTIVVEGFAKLSSTLSIQGPSVINNTLTVKDTTSIQGTTYLQSTLRVLDQTFLKTTLDVKDSALLSSTLSIGGFATFYNAFGVSGGMGVGSSLLVRDTVSVENAAMLQSTLRVEGSVVLADTANVKAQSLLQSTLSVGDVVYVNGELSVQGPSVFESQLGVNSTTLVQGNTVLQSTLNVVGSAYLSSTLSVDGCVAVASTLSVGSASFFASTLSVSGATALNSALVVSDSTFLSGDATMNSSLNVASGTTFKSTVDVSGAATLFSTLLVRSDMDVCGNVAISGQLSTGQGASFSGPFILQSTLTVNGSSYFENQVQANTFRSYTTANSGEEIITIDASRVVINGSVDLVGQVNFTKNTADSMLLEDKVVKVAYDICGTGMLADGTNTNSGAGIQIDGLPEGVSSDQSDVYKKSFTWEYDSLSGHSWEYLGKNSANNTTMPKEPTWLLRGGAFKIAHRVDGSNAVMFTMRINGRDEYEIWQSLSVDGGETWSHRRVNRMGATVPVAQVSIISEFIVALGDAGVGTTSMSLRITSVTDDLYPTKRVVPTFTATNIYLIDVNNNTYPVQNGFTFGTFTVNPTNNYVTMSAQMITGLSPDKVFKAVRATITNQYGSLAILTALVTPNKATLDAAGPQIVNSVRYSANNLTRSIDVSLNAYDIGSTTVDYSGVIFLSRSSAYDASAVTLSTPNTQNFTGTGKTANTSDLRSFTFTSDISGTQIYPGTYYVYYVLSDPLGNRTTNESGPSFSVIATPASTLSAFTVSLGATTNTSSSLSLKITSVTDNLYSVWQQTPYFTASNIKLVDVGDNEYSVQGGFDFGVFNGNSADYTVSMNTQIVTGLSSDTQFKAVKATITNQYGSYAALTANVSPNVYTLDVSGPQVVSSVRCAANDLTRSIDVSLNTYDIGKTTTSYTGVIFVSTSASYTLTSITSSTPNTQSFTGTGKTAGTADYNLKNFTTDISGATLTLGTYYVYFVLYDPNGNRTTNQSGPSLSTTIQPASTISAYEVALGETTVGTSTLSLKVTRVTDTLYATRGVTSQFTAANIKIVTAGDVEYAAQGGFSLGTFNGNGIDYTVTMSPQTVTGLPSDTYFKAVKATLTNQYGVSASLTASVSPSRATLDASGPQILGSINVTTSELLMDVSLNTYDIGFTTSTYTGVIFVSTNASYVTTSITNSTANTWSFTGTGKTSGTADYNSRRFTTDISGAALASGTYYVYYVLYDPLANRTEGRVTTAYTLVSSTTTVVDPSGLVSVRLAFNMTSDYYSGYTSPTHAVMLTSSDRVVYLIDNVATSTDKRIETRIMNSPYITTLYRQGIIYYANRTVPANVGMMTPIGDLIYVNMGNGGNTDLNITLYKYENYATTLTYNQGYFAYQDSNLAVLRAISLGYTGIGDFVFYAYHGRNDGWQYCSSIYRIAADRGSISKLADLGSTGSGQNNGFLTNPKLAIVPGENQRMGSSAIIATDINNGGFVYVYVNTGNYPQLQRYSYNGTSYVKGNSTQLFAITISNPTGVSDDLVVNGGAHVFPDGSILFMYNQNRVVYNTSNTVTSAQGAANGNTGMTNTYFGSYKGYAIVRMGELGSTNQNIRAVNASLQEVANYGLMPTLKYAYHNSVTDKLLFVDASGFVIRQNSGYDIFANNKSLTLNGTSQYATLSELLNYSGAWTMSIWIKMISVPTSTYGHIWDGRVTNLNIVPYNFEFYVNTGGAYIGGFDINSSTTLRDMNWHHVTFTTDGTSYVAYYEDASLKASRTTVTDEARMTRVQIGHWLNTSFNYSNVCMDEIALFNKGMLQNEVTAVYNNGVPINLKANSGNYTSKASLQAWWRFELNNGNDDSGNNRTLTLYNTPTYASVVAGGSARQAAMFGENIYAYSDNTVFRQEQNFSVTAWVRIPTYTTSLQSQIYMHGRESGQAFRGVDIRYQNNKASVYYQSRDTPVPAFATTQPGVPIETWVHVAVTKENSQTGVVNVYVNGTLIGSGNASNDGTIGTQTLWRFFVGARNTSGGNSSMDSLWFMDNNSYMNNMTVWSGVLTGTQVTSLYNKQNPLTIGASATLLSWWKLETDLNDYSGNGRNLSQSGTILFNTL